jgi:folylpolyglutamate synthase/dihydropteroate synthase
MQENNMIVENIMKIVCEIEKIQFTNDLTRVIEETSQPCRMESVKNRNEKIILDVCHNIDGFQAVITQIKHTYPQLESIKIVLGMSKSKKMN